MKKEKTTKLDAGEYWEWRTTITEMQLADSRLRETEVVHKALGKDVEIAQLRYQLYSRVNVDNAKQKSREARSEYDSFKLKLELKYNITLTDKIIDDFNFEIKNLPPENGKES